MGTQPRRQGGAGDITEVIAGDGLTGGAAEGSATINVGAGTGMTVTANAVALSYTQSITVATGKFTFQATADATDLVEFARTNTGAGRAIIGTMGLNTTGHWLEVDSATGATGYHLRGLRATAQTWAIDADGRLSLGTTEVPGTTAQLGVFRTSGSIFQARPAGSANFEVHAIGYVRTHLGVTFILTNAGVGSGAGVRCGRAAAGASYSATDAGIVFGNGRRVDTGGVGTDTYTSTSGDLAHVTMMSVASPASGSLDYVQLHLRPNFNGTSSGTATVLAIAPDVDAWTGGTMNLMDVGVSTSDYFTGFTSYFKIASTGAITAAPASGGAISFVATGAAATFQGVSSGRLAINASGDADVFGGTGRRASMVADNGSGGSVTLASGGTVAVAAKSGQDITIAAVGAGGDVLLTSTLGVIDTTARNHRLSTKTATTTDATVTTIETITTTSDRGYMLEVHVSAIQSDGSNGAGYTRLAAFRNDGGTISEITGSPNALVSFEDAAFATCDVTITISGTNILVRVTGVAATTINWAARVVVVET